MDAVGMRPVILITGASGFTGVHACGHFRAAGMRVVAFCRRPERCLHVSDETVVCDITERQRIRQIMRASKPDYVLHLAGMNDVRTSWNDPVACFEANVLGTLYLLDAAASLSQSPRVLIVGSALGFDPSGDPPRPTHPYSLSKTLQTLTSRAWSHLFDLPALVAEPTNLIGPGGSTGLCGLLAAYIARWEQGLTNEPFQVTTLTERRNYLDVRDAVAAYETLLRAGKAGALYRIGSFELRSIGDVLSAFAAAIGRPFPYVNLQAPPRDPDPQAIPSMGPLLDIGWAPRIPFAQSIRDLMADARVRHSRSS